MKIKQHSLKLFSLGMVLLCSISFVQAAFGTASLVHSEFGVTEVALYFYKFFPSNFNSHISTVKYRKSIKLLKPCAL